MGTLAVKGLILVVKTEVCMTYPSEMLLPKSVLRKIFLNRDAYRNPPEISKMESFAAIFNG